MEDRSTTWRVGKPRPGTIQLWTIQPLEVWERLQKERVLFVDPRHPDFTDEYLDAYDWLRKQMAHRLPGYQGHYLWWAYDYKVDLRSWRYQIPPSDQRHIRIELALPIENVLLSSYSDWLAVLNGCYLPAACNDEAFHRELDAFNTELTANGIDPYRTRPLPEPWQSRVISSWERIFDIDGKRDTHTIQATFERLELTHIVSITTFRAGSRRESRPAAETTRADR